MILKVFFIMMYYASFAEGIHESNIHYAIIFDCGSTGTRAKVYQYPEDNHADISPTVMKPDVEEKLKVKPGISDTDDLKTYFRKLLTTLTTVLDEEQRKNTKVYALATAGMRLLSPELQKKKFLEIREVLNDEEFKDHFPYGDAKIITGGQEGVDAFISVNMETKADEEFGILDLGGASTQIAFNVDQGVQIMASDHLVKVGEHNPELIYSHSFLNMGQNEAIKRTARELSKQYGDKKDGLNHPCFNNGFTQVVDEKHPVGYKGEFNEEKCRALIKDSFPFKVPCLQEPCSFDGVYQPKIPGGEKFLAFSAYYYTVNGLMSYKKGEKKDEYKNVSINEIKDILKKFCEEDYETITANDKYATNYCFTGIYMTEILEAYGFSPDSKEQIIFTKHGGWTEGAASSYINPPNSNEGSEPPEPTTRFSTVEAKIEKVQESTTPKTHFVLDVQADTSKDIHESVDVNNNFRGLVHNTK